MAWVRIDDEMPTHPKFTSLPIEACWLHICGLTYCSKYETDGVVKESAIGVLLAGKKTPAATRKLVPLLLEAGLWKPHPEGYAIHDFLKYNRSREQQEAKREATRQRVAKARASQSASRNGASNAVTDSVVTPLVTPTPKPLTPKAPEPQNQDLQGVANELESVSTVPPPDAPPQPDEHTEDTPDDVLKRMDAIGREAS